MLAACRVGLGYALMEYGSLLEALLEDTPSGFRGPLLVLTLFWQCDAAAERERERVEEGESCCRFSLSGHGAWGVVFCTRGKQLPLSSSFPPFHARENRVPFLYYVTLSSSSCKPKSAFALSHMSEIVLSHCGPSCRCDMTTWPRGRWGLFGGAMSGS